MNFCDCSVDGGKFISRLTFSEECKFGNVGNAKTNGKICR